jgi:TPR repeat protein
LLNDESQFVFAKLLFEKNGPIETIAHYLRRSSANGNIGAIVCLAGLLMKKRIAPVGQDELITTFRSVGESGDQASQAMYSELVIRKEGLMPPEELAKHYRIAADNDNVLAMCEYADMLKSWEGVQKTVAKAISYYPKAADRNCVWAQYEYGVLLLDRESRSAPLNTSEKHRRWATIMRSTNAEDILNGHRTRPIGSTLPPVISRRRTVRDISRPSTSTHRSCPSKNQSERAM